MKKILIICVAFLLSFLNCNAENLNANKLYGQKVNSIFLVETQSSRGSGIILEEDGTFVTCFHVIEDANYINVKTKNGDKYKVTGFKYLNPEDDIAILTIKTTKKFVPFATNVSPDINVGETIYTISNPVNLKFVFSSGMINQFDKRRIQYSAPTSPGSSGGALFNSKGILLGIIASQYNPSEAQNINFAIQSHIFLPHLTDKVKNNSKNIFWTDFVASKLSKKELQAFYDFAFDNKRYAMLYKYAPYAYPEDELNSNDYYSRGLLGLLIFTDDSFGEAKVVYDAARYFSLSLLSNKNVEIAAFGLLVTSLLTRDECGFYASYKFLKKYPKSKEAALSLLNRAEGLIKEGKQNSKEYTKVCFDALKYCFNLAHMALEGK